VKASAFVQSISAIRVWAFAPTVIKAIATSVKIFFISEKIN
jgi:hypothetical protein